ncbi:MAG TPA: hypothetical protein VGR12_00695, partial [Solirubrobacteraceae bacterium]|nr:hypothetical protein [Solirubrobacteraceae bacterium]
FGTVADPNIGVQPAPDRTRPPLRPDAPCELQETPNLDARSGNRPPTHDTNPESKVARDRLEKVRALAIATLQAQLRLEGDDRKVLDRDITREELQELAKQVGG